MSPEAGFLLGKCSADRRNSKIMKSDDWYILWIAFQKKSVMLRKNM